MKFIRFAIPLLALLVFWTSCDNELDLTSDWKDVPIVYGMLSPTDTAQYIRVERAFLDPKVGALNFTKNPDSIYYKNATVQIINLATDVTYNLDRVDGNLEGYPRDPGVWAQTPNYLYKIKTSDIELTKDVEYQLVITKGDNLPVTKTSTTILGVPTIKIPLATGSVAFTGENYAITWVASEGATKYDVGVTFHYIESKEGNPTEFEPKTITWKPIIGVTPSVSNSGLIAERFKSIGFFQWLKDALPVKDVKRRAVSVDISVIAGGKEIQKYFDVSAANFGLTGSEVSASYSNIPGGAGIFSSFSKYTQAELPFKANTIDSIVSGQYTRLLNFIY